MSHSMLLYMVYEQTATQTCLYRSPVGKDKSGRCSQVPFHNGLKYIDDDLREEQNSGLTDRLSLF